MAPYEFTYFGVAYEIRFVDHDGRWSASLHRDGQGQGWPLLATYEGVMAKLSKDAIRGGFIAVAKWLIKEAEVADMIASGKSAPELAREL